MNCLKNIWFLVAFKNKVLVFLLMVELPILWDKGTHTIKVLIWGHINAYLISLLKLMALIILLNFCIVDNTKQEKLCSFE